MEAGNGVVIPFNSILIPIIIPPLFHFNNQTGPNSNAWESLAPMDPTPITWAFYIIGGFYSNSMVANESPHYYNHNNKGGFQSNFPQIIHCKIS